MRKSQTFFSISESIVFFFIILTGLGMLIFLNGCSSNQTLIPNQTPNQTQSSVQTPASPLTSALTPTTTTKQDLVPEPNPAPAPSSEKVVPEISAQFLTSLPVLYYHSIMLEPGNEVRMPPDQFVEQMTYLSEHGYHSISPDELERFLSGQGELPLKPFMITFDDGYLDNFQTALPVLQTYNFTATIFMVSSYINGKGFLSSEQLRNLVAVGWNIEGHTANHAHLTELNPSSLSKELRDSKDQLEKQIGKSVKYFAYPYGEYNSEIIKSLQKAGYKLAFTTERGWAIQDSDPFLIHRVYCYANMGIKEFERRLQNPEY